MKSMPKPWLPDEHFFFLNMKLKSICNEKTDAMNLIKTVYTIFCLN